MGKIVNNYLYLKYKKERKIQIAGKNRLAFASTLVLSAFASVFMLSKAQATENGLTHYPIDVDTVANGFLPAPGAGTVDIYTQWYNATSEAYTPYGPLKVNSSIFIFSPRFLYTLPMHFSLIKGFESAPTIGVITPLLDLNVEVPAYSQKGHILGLGDVGLEMDMSFNRPQAGYFSYVGLDIFFPNGSYKVGRTANLGQNYRTFEPQYDFTWIPTRRLSVNEALVLDFNTENKANGYQSGADFDNDWALNYSAFPAVLPNIDFGIQGYNYFQLGNDTINGVLYNNGNKGRSFGIGPQITINMFHHRGGIDIKYTHQFGVRNQSKGDKIWVEFGIPFG